MDPVELGHPDVLYRPLDEDSNPVKDPSNHRVGGRDDEPVHGLPLHEVEVRIDYQHYEQKRQAEIASEFERQLRIVRSKWQDKLEDLWERYCAVKYEIQHLGQQRATRQERNRKAAQELFDRWRETYRVTIGVAKHRFDRAEEEERDTWIQLVALQARRRALLRETVT